jgi:hypothetical protein
MNPRPEQPAEGRLIAEALARKGLSIREGARRAGISYGRWRQITNGWQSAGAGNYVPVTGPPATVARMAAAAGVSADALEAAGRPDAAKSLRERVPASVVAHLADVFREIEQQDDGDDVPVLTEEEMRILATFVKMIRTRKAERERGEGKRGA